MRAISITSNGEDDTRIKEVEINTNADIAGRLQTTLFEMENVMWFGEQITVIFDENQDGNMGRYVRGLHDPIVGNIILMGGINSENEIMSLSDAVSRFDIPKFITGNLKF